MTNYQIINELVDQDDVYSHLSILTGKDELITYQFNVNSGLKQLHKIALESSEYNYTAKGTYIY